MRGLAFVLILGSAMALGRGCVTPGHAMDSDLSTSRTTRDWGECVRSLAAARPDLTLTVHRVDGKGPRVLVSSGIPFPRGALLDVQALSIRKDGREIPIATRAIVKWPGSDSLRSVLVQFHCDLGTADRATVVLTVGRARTTPDLPLTPVTWTLPEAVGVPGKEWMSYTGVIGAVVPAGYTVRTAAGVVDGAAADASFAANYARYEDFRGGDRGVVEGTNYYDNTHTLYQQFVRTGNVEYYKLARRWAVYHRTRQIAPADSKWPGRRPLDGALNTRYTYVQGLVDDYLLTGDPASLAVAGLVVDQFYMRLEQIAGRDVYYKPPRQRGFWTEREPAFALLGIVCYYEATLKDPYLAEAKRIVHQLRRMQVENREIDGQTGFIHNLHDHDPGERARVDDWGGSTWMTGLLLEGIIRYHLVSQDPVAAESVMLAVDWLTARGRTGLTDSWVYFTAPARAGRPGYDLNQLVTHAYAYAYRLSDFKTDGYLAVGVAGYRAGVERAFLRDQKHLNQNYRSGPNFMGYLTEPGAHR